MNIANISILVLTAFLLDGASSHFMRRPTVPAVATGRSCSNSVDCPPAMYCDRAGPSSLNKQVQFDVPTGTGSGGHGTISLLPSSDNEIPTSSLDVGAASLGRKGFANNAGGGHRMFGRFRQRPFKRVEYELSDTLDGVLGMEKRGPGIYRGRLRSSLRGNAALKGNFQQPLGQCVPE